MSARPRTPRTIAKNSFTIEDFLARSTAGESSIKAYRYELGLIERWIGKELWQASERDVVNLKQKLRGMASGKQYVTFARMFYKAAGRADVLEILKIKQRAKRLNSDDLLSLPEVQKMIEACPSKRDAAFVAVLWDSGVRVHEVLALNVGDVKVTESQENGGRKVYVVWFGKVKVRGEEHRGFLIESAPFLEAWIRVHPNSRPDAPLFPSYQGRRLTKHGALGIVKGAAARAGIRKRVYNHLFRHSRCTHLLRLGLKETEIQRLLGWSPASKMIQRYMHLADVDDYAAALRAQGMAPPERVDLGKLSIPDESLRPVLPMVPGPGAAPALPAGTAEGDVDGMVQDMLKECGLTASELMAVFRVGMKVLERRKATS